MGRKFTMIDEGFHCENCNKMVLPLEYTARDHCPHCLHSKHLDIYPGDRSEECKGLLEPIGIEKAKKGFKIVFKCKKCYIVRRNIVAKDDNDKLIISLSGNPIIY